MPGFNVDSENQIIKAQFDKILQGILDVGEEMIVAGAEVARVEDSIFRMCTAYGFTRINVFIITSNMQVTVQAPDSEILTHIRQIKRQNNDFDKLDYLNDLSRKICVEKPSAELLQEKLKAVLYRRGTSIYFRMIGAILVASGFSVFFGATVKDAFVAGMMGIIVVLMWRHIQGRQTNPMVHNFIVSFLCGIGIQLFAMLGMTDNNDVVIMGDVMLLIPGMPLTNSIRDLLAGDTASGFVRLANALLIAAAIASGFGLSVVLSGGLR